MVAPELGVHNQVSFRGEDVHEFVGRRRLGF